MLSHFAGFLAIALIIIVTPGPDTALTIRNTMFGGRRGGIFTALGVCAGQATWTLATSAGIAALLAASEPVFLAVRLIGAAYLVFLGAHALTLALRGAQAANVSATATTAGRRVRPAAALRQGLISNLTNPKMAAFFPALLPQFVPSGASAFAALLTLGLLFSLITLVWLTGYALVVAAAGDFLRERAVSRVLEAATGTILVGLGLGLALERR